MKRLVITNATLLLFILTIFIFGYYFIHYPDAFNLHQYLREAEWQPLVVILLALIIVAAILSLVSAKNDTHRRKFLIFLAALQFLFFLFLLFKVADTYCQKVNEYEELVVRYKKKAASDIQTGFITIEDAGGLELPGDEQEQRMQREIDSVRRTFGLTYQNSGCIVYPALEKAQAEYIRFTKPFLDKRNGAGWEEAMNQKITAIRDSYPNR